MAVAEPTGSYVTVGLVSPKAADVSPPAEGWPPTLTAPLYVVADGFPEPLLPSKRVAATTTGVGLPSRPIEVEVVDAGADASEASVPGEDPDDASGDPAGEPLTGSA